MADERNRLKVLQELKKAQAELNSLQKDGERVFADNLDKNKAIAKEKQKIVKLAKELKEINKEICLPVVFRAFQYFEGHHLLYSADLQLSYIHVCNHSC